MIDMPRSHVLSPRVTRALGGLLVLLSGVVAGCTAPDHEAKMTAASDSAPVAQSTDRTVRPAAFTAAPVVLTPQASALDAFRAMRVDDAFQAVARGIRYEPYAGLQRGAEGTARAGRGNSLDQAVLLATALDEKVAAYRFVQGQLRDADAVRLLESIYPPDLAPQHLDADGLDLYDPAQDDALVARATDHYWLEIKRTPGDDWQPLDPSFPNAAVGEAYAKTQRTFGTPPRSLMQTLSVTLKQTTEGAGEKTLGSFSGMVAEMGLRPINVTITGTPVYAPVAQAETQNEDVQQPSLGNPFGGFAGGGRKQEEPAETNDTTDAPAEPRPVIGTDIVGTVDVFGQQRTTPVTKMRIADTGSYVRRLWLEFEVTAPGQPPRRLERALYEATPETATHGPVGFHRYTLTVVPGPVTRADFEAQRDQAAGSIDLPAWEAAAAQLTSPDADAKTLDKATTLEHVAGGAVGHLSALAFAAESDSLSQMVAYRGGVQMVYPLPRLLMTSIETRPTEDGVATEVSLDLRLDEVQAIPYPGVPTGAAPLFQRARGLQESALEGAVLRRLLGDNAEVVTTSALMAAAQEQAIDLLAVRPHDRRLLDQADDLPRWDARRIQRALDDGNHVVVPARAVDVGGAARWGWWQIDPATGAYVGVMEGGAHQAITSYQTTVNTQALNAAQGFLLGMLNGAVGTQVLLAAGMLKYGEYTEALKEEIKERIAYISCLQCPKFKVEVSLGSSGGASASSACYSFDIIESQGQSYDLSSPSLPYCKYYKQGVSCASSLLLDGLPAPQIEVIPPEGFSFNYTTPNSCQ